MAIVEIIMAWIYLVIAGLLETVWAIGLKYTDGFTKLWPSVGTIAAMVASVFLLSLALRSLPIGTGYAIWTGIGTVGVVIIGILVFGESASWSRLLFLSMIVVGILGLKLVSSD
jgi:quaternary ammonium compound-resistance protein SugE